MSVEFMNDFEVTAGQAWRHDDVFSALEGEWLIHRRLDGRELLNGRATFVHDQLGRLAYHERGRIRIDNGREFDAERRYVFVAMPQGFSVYFAETPLRLFHDVRLGATAEALAGQAEHLCAADLYRSRYEFLPDGRFVVQHAVSGPSKGYTLSTIYVRG